MLSLPLVLLTSLGATASVFVSADGAETCRPKSRACAVGQTTGGRAHGERPLPFSTALRSQNREGAAVGPVAFDRYLAAQNRERRATAEERARLASPCDTSASETGPALRERPGPPGRSLDSKGAEALRRLELASRARPPSPLGQLIDILA
jgi:hypothetical protein